MKKLSIALVVAALLALTAATASADMYPKSVTDVIDTWGILGIDAAPIVEGAPLTYFHDLNQEIDFATEYVTQATLALDFTNMGPDGITVLGVYIPVPGMEEHVTLYFDEVDGEFRYLGEIDEDNEPVEGIALNVDWINDDGILNVQVSVWNNGVTPAFISLDKSTLTAEVQLIPVPGAVLLGVLGLSAAGIKLRKNRAA